MFSKIKDSPVSRSFLNYGVWGRGIFIGMVALGVASLAVGLKTDVSSSDWSQSLGFLTNVWAGFTGFLIGVPVALVVLSTVTRQSEDKAASDRVENLTRIAWNQFRDAVYDLCSEQRCNEIGEKAQHLRALHNQTFTGFKNYRTDPDRSEESYTHMLDFIEWQINLWNTAFEDITIHMGHSISLQMKWFAILRDWNTLDQYVRLQRLERGLGWFDRDHDSVLQQAMHPDKHPLREFLLIHEGPNPISHDWQHLSMWAAFNSVHDLLESAGSGHETLVKALDSRGEYFPNKPIDGYLEKLGSSLTELHQLRNVVQDIDCSDWLTGSSIDGKV